MAELPSQWLHSEDELYDKLRGPAQNMEILATSFSDEKFDGTNRHEPILMTIKYGKGKIFHTVMGHNRKALSCVGFMTTFIRGCEWAADKKVTFDVPVDFPKEKVISTRTY
jgi:type 1 glutamine amidotransferase